MIWLRWVTCGLGCWLAAETARADEPIKPNVLLIVVDDLGYGELGSQGNPQIPTPAIDSLAKNGVRFTSGYVTASFCSPSRAGLLTGRYQTRFGHELNPVGKHNLHPKAGLPASERTLAKLLKSAGYATGLVGKWHLGGTEADHPMNHGFDEFYGFLHEGHFFVPPPYDGVLSFLRKKTLPPDAINQRHRQGNVIYSSHLGTNEPPYDEHNPMLRGRERVVEPAYLTDAFAREAVAFLDRHQAEPFFLYLAFNAVHSPMQARAEDLKPFEALDVHRRVFAGMLSNLDRNVGRVLEELRRLKLEERTLIFFLSDNGGPTEELTSSNRPLRGGKGNLYEGGLRVPFLVQWKGRLPQGMVYDDPVISTDVFATASAVAGVSLPQGKPIDGVNLLPFVLGTNTAKPHDVLFWRMQHKTALRQGDWKIVQNPGRGRSPGEFELYDLKTDIAESRNLAATHPEKIQELTKIWTKLNGQMIAPKWRRLPEGAEGQSRR